MATHSHITTFTDMEKFLHIPIEIISVVTAIFGGCARYLNDFVNGKPFSMSVFIASAFVAGFSGYMFALFGESLNLPLPMPNIMAGVGGFFGERTMKLILEYVAKKTD
jgi:hypothetical protein